MLCMVRADQCRLCAHRDELALCCVAAIAPGVQISPHLGFHHLRVAFKHEQFSEGTAHNNSKILHSTRWRLQDV